VEPPSKVIRAIMKGDRPPTGVDLSGVTLDGKQFPRREREIEWDLTGTNLRGAVLTRLDLGGARFVGADVSGAAFRNVSLSQADFHQASAAGAIFEDVNLAFATFREADLRGASFSYVNLADINFKDADMRGASVNAVRFSLNGGTHALGLKEALNHRYHPVSYPFVVGVSGDAFWLSYLTETGALQWGGFAKETLRRGLAACGFASELVNELDVEEAWRLLTHELATSHGVITPLHVGGRHITGSGFGGSEWVYVSDYDPAEDAVHVRCLLGDDIVFSWDEFIRAWCIRHPLEQERNRIVYTFCVIGDRVEEVSPADAALRGIHTGLELLDLAEFPEEDAVCGIPAYDLLLRDLDVEVPVGREACQWLGLGIMHLHGSRWAIRDFLLEIKEQLPDKGEPIDRAIAAYEGILGNLTEVMRLLPGAPDGDEEALRGFLSNREGAARELREARSREEEARDALREVVEP
jgi:hypothetical protein